MFFFFVIFTVGSCILSGYRAGSVIDYQYKSLFDSKRMLVTIPASVRWLYVYGQESTQVLIHSFIVETSGILSAVVTLIGAVMTMLFEIQSMYYLLYILCIHGFFLLVVSILICITVKPTSRSSNFKKCWHCEFEYQLTSRNPHRKVIIISFSEKQKLYRIRCKKFSRCEYVAISHDVRPLQIGELLEAVYYPSGPYFVIIRPDK